MVTRIRVKVRETKRARRALSCEALAGDGQKPHEREERGDGGQDSYRVAKTSRRIGNHYL